MKTPKISAVVNTLNEEQRLPFCLRSLKPWVDEIIVVDMQSDDRTVEVARSFGAQVFLFDRMGYADPARAFAVSKAVGKWIIMLDADELVPLELSRLLCEIVDTEKVDVVNIPWINYFFGAPLSYTGWGPDQDKHFRFFRAGFLQVTSDVHDFLKPVADARVLDLPYEPGHAIVHFNYIDVAHFIEKLNRYTSIEADLAYKLDMRVSSRQAIIQAFRGFYRRYFRQKGYRDGWRGLYLSLFWAFYRLSTNAKLIQLQLAGTHAEIEALYQTEAERLLSGYSNAEQTESLRHYS